MVLAELVIACRLAICPMRRSPFSVNATTDGVVRPPSLLGTICVTPPSRMATHEFVVPRSMPMTLPIIWPPTQKKPGKALRGRDDYVGAVGTGFRLLSGLRRPFRTADHKP